MKHLPALSIIALSISSAHAQYFEPAPFYLTDGFSIIPQVSGVWLYDDNIFNDEANGLGSSVQIITPHITFGSDDGINQYGGEYELRAANYTKSSDDNYIDHVLMLQAHHEFTMRHRTDINVGFSNIHEDRGTELTEADPDFYNEPLKYNEYLGQAYYQYGAMTSSMRIGVGIAYADKRYTNFKSSVKYSDLAGLKFYSDLEYQLGSVTFATLDLYVTDFSYRHLDPTSASRDNVDTNLLVGLKWEGLAKTTGVLKAGYQDKNFSVASRDDTSDLKLDLEVTWNPLEYSTFITDISYGVDDSTTIGDYDQYYGITLDWEHYWTERLNTTAGFLYRNDEFNNSATDNRKDDTYYYTLGVNYEFARWLKVAVGYEFTDKQSNANQISYDKGVTYFTVVASL